MALITSASVSRQEAVAMGLRSKIPELLAAKGWTQRKFAARCMEAGLAVDTANRLARGETDVRTSTLRVVAKVLGVTSFDDMIVITEDPDPRDQE